MIVYICSLVAVLLIAGATFFSRANVSYYMSRDSGDFKVSRAKENLQSEYFYEISSSDDYKFLDSKLVLNFPMESISKKNPQIE